MDILLTHGYFLYADPHEQAVMRPYPPLGILYISSHLKAKGFEVAVFDATFSSTQEFEAYLARERPSITGIYCNLMTRQRAVEMVKICKRHGSTVIVGGPEPANYAEEYLARGADVVVIGEGERTLEELVPHLQKHGPEGLDRIQGIAFRGADGRVVTSLPRPQIENLTAQPYPDRAAIDIPRYLDVWRTHHGTGSVSLITARGCPYKCKWCSHAVFGYTHRRRLPENVADEVRLIHDTYKPDIVWYADDVFTINHRWLYAYHQALNERGLKLPFETISREDRLNEKVIETLADMGCYRIWLGSESGSQAVLDRMTRGTSAEGTRDMARLLKSYGIEVGMFIMFGYDGETMGDLEKTAAHLKESNPDVFLTTVAYPIKGTAYYDAVADKVIPLKTWDQGSDRDFTVAGRHSRKFYSYATRWLVGEVDFHTERSKGSTNLPRLAKSYLNGKIGRLGMALTKHEVESG